jgi:hypothetical protein
VQKAAQNLRFPVNLAENKPEAGGLMPEAKRSMVNRQQKETSKLYYNTAPYGAFYFINV